MENPIKVEITGTAISFLYSAAASSSTDSEGLVVGIFEESQSETFSDTQEGVITRTTHAKITGVLHSHQQNEPHALYDSAGNLKTQEILKLTKSSSGRSKDGLQVIGWYAFRRGMLPLPSLCELIAHSQMAEFFIPEKPEKFLFCVIQSSASELLDTHEFLTKFYTKTETRWQLLNGTVSNSNAGKASRSKGHYRSTPTFGQGYLEKLQQGLRNKKQSATSQMQVDHINKRIFHQLREYSSQITELREQIEALESTEALNS